MNPVHVDINWQNDTAPAINQTNLGQINNELATYDSRIITLDTTKAAQSDMLLAFKDVSLNSTTGVITFTLFNNTTKTIDTLLEKVAINFDYDDDPTSPHYQNLIIELEDGTYKYIDMSALITEYEFTDSSTIDFTVTSGAVSASVIDGSITATKLDPTFAVAINDAEANGLKSEGFANGTQNGTPVTSGSPYYENNAKYWKEQAQAIASQSLSGLTDVSIQSPQDGQTLVYDAANNEWVNGSGSYNAEREVSPALKNHAVGDLINVANVTYEVTASISIGDALTIGTNIAVPTLAEASVVYTYGAGLYKRFDECTDSEIAVLVSMADAGLIDLYDDCGWRVGQEHQTSIDAIPASGTGYSVGEAQVAQTITLVLMHKGLYELVNPVLDKQGNSRSVCSFVVGMKGTLSTSGYMNSTATSSGGWDSCARRAWCNNGFRNALPSSLRGAFKQFKTKAANASWNPSLTTSYDYFALAASKEVLGGTASSEGAETGYSTLVEFQALTQFSYYMTASHRTKGTVSNAWLLRSPSSVNNNFAAIVDSTGAGAYTVGNGVKDISPFGCL